MPVPSRCLCCVVLLAALAAPAALGAEADPPPPAAPPANTLTQEQIAAGWIQLFDGETTFGWEPIGRAKWAVTDGVLHSDGGKPGWLVTTSEFADFILRFEYRMRKGGLSRVCYRRNRMGEGVAPAFGSGAPKLSRKQAGFIPNVWQPAVIRAQGDIQIATLQGAKWFDSTDAKFPDPMRGFRRGTIAFAADSSAGRPVELRNICIKPLGLKPIFNGKDLSGWKVFPGKKSVFTVTKDGELSVMNGPGDLQTEKTWADFCLQLDVMTHGEGLNSGVFFRCIPGQFTQGYESQIKNAWKDGDRTKPVDYGTGGIYRRQPARKVVSDDKQWLTKTLIATGRHMAVWVHGYPVTDWTDPRPLADNPRKGCRLAAGAISLQGHDPTTNLSFRNIRIAEYPKAKR